MRQGYQFSVLGKGRHNSVLRWRSIIVCKIIIVHDQSDPYPLAPGPRGEGGEDSVLLSCPDPPTYISISAVLAVYIVSPARLLEVIDAIHLAY